MENSAHTPEQPTRLLIPVSKWDNRHAWPTPQAFRNQIAKAKRTLRSTEKGGQIDPAEVARARDLLHCFCWINGRVVVDESRWFQFVEKYSQSPM